MVERIIWVDCPLGPDKLLFRSMAGREELGRPFEFDLELHTEERALELNDLLGHPMTVHVPLADDGERLFHGYVVELAQTGAQGSYLIYRAKLRPWFSLLGYNSNCRIFQDKTVLEIAEEIFKDNGFEHYELMLTEKNYRRLEYAVQYRESDFGFVSRLLEQDGIYYFFRHEQDKDVLVLADAPESHDQNKLGDVRYMPVSSQSIVEEHLDQWSVSKRLQPGAFIVDDYDFKRPRAALSAKLAAPLPHGHSTEEIYDYPGEYAKLEEGETLVRIRLQQLHAQFERMEGSGNVRTLAPGSIFTLKDFPREDQNQDYLIVATSYMVQSAATESESSGQSNTFHTTIAVIKAATPFRPAFTTPRPFIAGHQTATVVGKSGEEIWTDEYGRVKLQFRWDRRGESNEQSSCWVRVSQAWAGGGWGAIHVPRIGQEVLVSFLDGDPDRPIIVGRVYNGAAKPPFELPNKAMVSGLKSDSTPGGGGYNEISMDDTKGEEKLTQHAQKDMSTTVEHDKTLTVHNNRTSTVDVDDAESVGNNQTVSVGVNQVIGVGSNRDLTVGANATETIGANKSLAVGADYRVSVGGSMNEAVTGLKAEKVGKAKSLSVGEGSTENVSDSKSVKVGKDLSEEVGQNLTIKAGKKMTVDIGDAFALTGKKKGVIELSDELAIKVGSASIVLKKNGDITIKGMKISVNGTGDVVLKGMKVTQN